MFLFQMKITKRSPMLKEKHTLRMFSDDVQLLSAMKTVISTHPTRLENE
jgi:hypothetical protein